MPERLRVLLVDQHEERSSGLARCLEADGCAVVAHSTPSLDLAAIVDACQPDVVIIDVDSPDRDVFEGMRRLGESQPRPTVLFSNEAGSEAIRTAIRAGVAAYVVKGAQLERVRPVIEVAIAQFESHRALVDEVAQLRSTLEERKVVDRAKGLLMARCAVSEEEAYGMLRKLAMDRSLRLADVARRVIEMSDLL